jgi:hypothetical protein
VIVVLDPQSPLRGRLANSISTPDYRSLVLGLAPPPARVVESAWPKWLLSFEHAPSSEAHSVHRRSRRSS